MASEMRLRSSGTVVFDSSSTVVVNWPPNTPILNRPPRPHASQQIWTLQRVWAPHTVAYFTFKERFIDCRRFFNELEASEGRVKFETEEVESFDSLGVDELCLYVVRGNLAFKGSHH